MTVEDELDRARRLVHNQEYDEAEPLLKELSRRGVSDADFYLADIRYTTATTEEAEKEAIKAINALAETGCPMALWQSGFIQEESGQLSEANKLYAQAVAAFEARATRGDNFSRVWLGWVYSDGECIPKVDRRRAEQFLRDAVNDGYLQALIDLALFLIDGEHASKSDIREATELLETAAAGGSAVAATQLGLLYGLEPKMPLDPVKSVYWYQKAHELGSLQATCNLARMKLSGEGCEENRSEGLELLRYAASKGFDEARESLDRELRSGAAPP